MRPCVSTLTSPRELLIETLRTMPGQQGVIGAQRGSRVKTLPSTIYWNGLLTLGILRRDVAPEGLAAERPQLDDADELAARAPSDWHPTIPRRPTGSRTPSREGSL